MDIHATLKKENPFRYDDHASARLCLIIQRCLCVAWGFAVQPYPHCCKYLIENKLHQSNSGKILVILFTFI